MLPEERSQSDIMAGLVAAGVQIDAWDTYGGTALEDAAIADFLLDLGHPVDAENNNPRHIIELERSMECNYVSPKRKNYRNSAQSWGRP